MLASAKKYALWKENLRKNAEANPTLGALRLIETTPHSGAFSVATGSKSGAERQSKSYETMQIAVTKQALAALRQLNRTGLYGGTVEETAERLLCESLRRHAELPARRQPRSNHVIANPHENLRKS